VPEKATFNQDCDDDGEACAGGRLLHMMQVKACAIRGKVGQEVLRGGRGGGWPVVTDIPTYVKYALWYTMG